MISSASYQSSVRILVDRLHLEGDLVVPEGAGGLVLFAHGSGSSRFSPRNKMVADYLNQQGIGTLLFDLMTTEEDRVYANRFDIPLLAHRLKEVKEWVMTSKACRHLPVGYFGASTGAAAALMAAAGDEQIAAVVSRGGRPDLALASLLLVQAATLLIVGSLDTEVLRLNQKAFEALGDEKQLQIVPGASHLFEEKGTMDKVCELANAWFAHHFAAVKRIT